MTSFLIKTSMPQSRLGLWIHGLFAAFIGGGATAGSSWVAMTGAHSVGLDIPVLNAKALGIIFLSGAVTNSLAYLKQSPLPNGTINETPPNPPAAPPGGV